MGENSKIEWCHHTFNPWIGCTKIAEGCRNCYAEAWAKRSGQVQFGPHPRRRTSAANWQKPLQWDKKAYRFGTHYRVFCASLADVFDETVPTAWRDDLFQLINDTPNLDWLLLTKRPENVQRLITDDMLVENVWLGTTVCNQADAEQNIPALLEIPARVRFLSCEPLLGPVKFSGLSAEHGRMAIGAKPGINWVIVGGETGAKARPMHPNWARSLRDECDIFGTPFFFKSWGEFAPCPGGEWHGLGPVGKPKQFAMSPDGRLCDGFLDMETSIRMALEGWKPIQRIGRLDAGNLLDGRLYQEVPS